MVADIDLGIKIRKKCVLTASDYLLARCDNVLSSIELWTAGTYNRGSQANSLIQRR
jgi:hypothetical protein